ncbi:hypothetical protein BpHYR1_016560 [Brachionus plicatilis]|uniref:Uncharacterized protein n=1 Tax=Brachionus plicatilis TaxID=10195 RepID=A0A3M7P561_BRAPC|nr:hypothetical protein BpHYR1_016560 [Brachionus plicatilis]
MKWFNFLLFELQNLSNVEITLKKCDFFLKYSIVEKLGQVGYMNYPIGTWIMVKIVRIKNVSSDNFNKETAIIFLLSKDQYPLLEPMHNHAQTSHSQSIHFV